MWPAIAAVAASTIGSALAGRSAERAAQTSANAQLEAAQIAAEEQRFRPVGVTTRFGRSMFQFGPEGRLTGAGYETSPEIRAFQDRLAALYGTSLGQAEQAQAAGMPLQAAGQRLFGLGGQYLAESPEAAREQFIAQQQALLEPSRMREEARLGASVFGRGRAGLNIGDIGQPNLFALAQARRQQDLQLAAQAEQAAQQRVGFGAGLFGTGAGMYGTSYQLPVQALAPFQTQFGLTQLLEQAGQQPLDIGAQLGGRTATAGAKAGESLVAGGLGAARTRLQGALVGPSLMAESASRINYNQLFDRLMNRGVEPGVNVGGFGYAGPQLSAEQAADYFGGNPYDPSLFANAGY